VADVGVIDAEKLVVTKEVEVVVVVTLSREAETTCNTHPVGKVAFGIACDPVS
jgi:hypothetical protein